MGRVLEGQVILVEGDRRSPLDWIVAWATHSWWTQVYITVDKQQAVAPRVLRRVHVFSRPDALEQLQQQDRAYVVFAIPGVEIQGRWRISRRARQLVGSWWPNPLAFVNRVVWLALRRCLVQSGSRSPSHLLDLHLTAVQFSPSSHITQNPSPAGLL